MATQVQELIDKIQSEGVHEAERKAGQIEADARKQAEKIVSDAKAQAQEILVSAEQESKKISEATRMALKQAARDMLLNLRNEIEKMLSHIIKTDVHQALKPEALLPLIEQTIKSFISDNKGVADITVTLSAHDLKKLKDGYLAKLKTRIKQPVDCRASDEIAGGFTISFDQGKSCFDFSDESLVEFLSHYVNAQTASLLKESLS